ncbi:tryptophan--tRNA ligase [Patescibacteria group bacterium]|nr:tryptophan--tRNA ligase [Patescibacteria group bacterium]
MSSKKRVVSGITTSGELHLGNYIGALQQFIALQSEYDGYFFLADLHALATVHDPEKLRKSIRSIANLYLACGLDPEQATFFCQSALPAHAELGWMLNTISTMGELSRMTQYKDKSAGNANDSIQAGLFTYPTLMAADILLYQPKLVPVGDDQKQHIELTRNLAERFNKRFSETFTVPDVLTPKQGARIMGLDDPSKKMSKSASSAANYIALVDSPEAIKKKISKAVTDSGTEIKAGKDRPALTNLLTIFSELEDVSVADLEKRYGGKSYRDFKSDLADVIIATLKPVQKTLEELETDPKYVDDILAKGAEKARPVAAKTLAEAKTAMGLG